ncbi:MAG: UDP-glucose/GDP-mannose dehydrogenase family protein [Planctomycetota bacterium]
MKLAIIGTGHVGLVTGLGFADAGHDVICQDVDANKINGLANGKAPIFEPGLDELLARCIAAGKVNFRTDLTSTVRDAEVLFVCVGTPPQERGQSDLSFVELVARQVAECAQPGVYRLVVDKSTVPVKTAERVRQTLNLYGGDGTTFGVASNPEFLREGNAVDDTLRPDRIVVGVSSEQDAALLDAVYKPIIAKVGCPYIQTDVRSAEMIKHVANAFLSTRLSFINMVARVCDATGAVVDEVLRGVTLDARIGSAFFRPGIGYGGSCFPKDVPAFAHIAEEHGIDATLLWAVHDTNQTQAEWFFDKIRAALWILRGKPIAVWGLAFKQDTDDVRESPAIRIVQMLLDAGAQVRAYDPRANHTTVRALGINGELPAGLTLMDDPLACCDNADALIVGTEWKDFAAIDPAGVKSRLRLPLVFDGKNVLDVDRWRAAGFVYEGVGRTVPELPHDHVSGTRPGSGATSRTTIGR